MKVSGWLAKVAVAVVSAPRVNVQLGFVLPAQGPPVQLAKRAVVGEANRVIEVPDAKLAVHVAPQAIAAGELATLPVPPFWTLVTVSVNVPDGEGGGASEVLKVALTVMLLLIWTVQEPVPVQPPPLQPAKTNPEAGTTVTVTVVPLRMTGNRSFHS